jgi:hypothetical protein
MDTNPVTVREFQDSDIVLLCIMCIYLLHNGINYEAYI